MTQIARARMTISGLEGGNGLLTAYFAGPGDITSAEALEALKRVRACVLALQSDFSNRVTYTPQPTVDILTAETGALAGSFGVAAPAAVVGSASTDMLPGQVQGLIHLNTGAVVGGRRVNGRINVAGVVEGSNDTPGTPSASLVADLGTAGAVLNTLITTAISNVVWHRPKSGAGGSAVLVTSYTGGPKWATLKSRRD